MNVRGGRAIPSLVVVLLIWGIFQPMALTDPYYESGPEYAIAHESTPAFERTIEAENISTDGPTPVSDLSPNARRAFDEAVDQPPTHTRAETGWHYLGHVDVCKDELYYCDRYTESPEFPGTAEGTTGGRYGLVEAENGDVYLTDSDTGDRLALAGLVEFVVRFLSFGPYALALAVATAVHHRTHQRETVKFAGYGVGLVALAFAFPYLVMVTPMSVYYPTLGFLGLTWALLLYCGSRFT